MNFFAHYKISFVDYPGKISTLLFVSGCNLNCVYCHNFSLQKRLEHKISENNIFEFIEKRKGIIDAVVVTGGEPSLYEDMIEKFFIKISYRFPGLLKKVDTNGTNPNFIERISKYVDFISMDFKTLYYEKFLKFPTNIIIESLEKIKKYMKDKDYEIRITVYPEYISTDDFLEIGKLLKGVKKIAIQQYRPVNSIRPYPDTVLQKFARSLKIYAEEVYIKK